MSVKPFARADGAIGRTRTFTFVAQKSSWVVLALVGCSHAAARFDRVVLLEATAETSANVGIGDLDGDGDLDLVLAKGRHWPLVDRVLLNDGHGRFPSASNLGDTADRSYSSRLVDLDGDRDLDVVVGNDAPDPGVIYLNDGHGRFARGGTYGKAAWPTRNVDVADVNADGRPDIIVANRSEDAGGANYVCLNGGAATFDAECIAFSQEPATTIVAADIDRDGAADLVVPHRDGGQSHVYLNDGSGGFARRVPFGPPNASIRVVAAADLDGDGRLDLVTIDERAGTNLYFGAQAGFSPALSIEGAKPTPYALALGDVDRDGKIDVVVGHVEAPSALHLNDGTGRRFTRIPFGDNRGVVYGFALGDLDGDGTIDIAAARSEAPNVVYLGRTR